MRALVLAGLFTISAAVVAVPTPADAGGLNCWYEEIYSDDVDIDGDGHVDPLSGQIIGVIAHCDVEQDEVTP